jgi:hypothetical protein
MQQSAAGAMAGGRGLDATFAGQLDVLDADEPVAA